MAHVTIGADVETGSVHRQRQQLWPVSGEECPKLHFTQLAKCLTVGHPRGPQIVVAGK